MKPNRMKIIGLTGGIGAGKSTVAGLLAARGVAIIDADEISRRLVSQKGPLLDALTQTLGPRILDAAGNFDRKKTADLVFGDSVALSQLQAILHKHIAVQMKADVQKLKEKGIRLVALDVPLPVKDGFLDLCDTVWVVDADLELRIARLMADRGYTREECLRRMETQLAPADYLALADVVLDNNAGPAELEAQVAEALGALRGQEINFFVAGFLLSFFIGIMPLLVIFCFFKNENRAIYFIASLVSMGLSVLLFLILNYKFYQLSKSSYPFKKTSLGLNFTLFIIPYLIELFLLDYIFFSSSIYSLLR